MFSLICRRQTLLFPHKSKVRKAPDILYEWNRVPPRTGKPGKMRRHFPVMKKSGNFEQTGKVRKMTINTGKPREFQTTVICYF